MCFNAPLSLALFLASLAVGYWLLSDENNERMQRRGVFIIAVSLIQLVEFMIWRTCDRSFNRFLTSAIGFVLALQLLVVAATSASLWLFIPSGIFTMFYSLSLLAARFEASVDPMTGRLRWMQDPGGSPLLLKFLGGLYIATLLSALYINDDFVSFVAVSGALALSAIYTRFNESFGSFWCFSSALLLILSPIDLGFTSV